MKIELIDLFCVFFFLKSNSPGIIRFRLDSIRTISRTVCSLSSSIEVKYQSDLALAGARFGFFYLIDCFLDKLSFFFLDGVEIQYHQLG